MRVYGKNPVIERLKADPRSIIKIYLQNGHPDAGYIYKKAKKNGIPIHAMPKVKMDKISRNLNAQGLMAEIGEFMYLDYSELLDRARDKNLCLVFADSLTDPQNLGGMIRSCACLGGFALVLPTHGSVSVTETVIRVACGGEIYVPIAKVANIGKAVRRAKELGFLIAGTVVQGGDDLYQTEFSFPLGLIIGSEQKGIRPVVRTLLDYEVTLPMAQPRMSLNAAHAATLFCYEVARQRRR